MGKIRLLKAIGLCLIVLLFQPSIAHSGSRDDRLLQRTEAVIRELAYTNPNCSIAITKAEALITELSRTENRKDMVPYIAMGILLCAVENDKHDAVLKFGPIAENSPEFKAFAIRFQIYAAMALERSDQLFEILRRLDPNNDVVLTDFTIAIWWQLRALASTSGSPNTNRLMVHHLAKRISYNGFSLNDKRAFENALLQTLILSNGDTEEIGGLLLALNDTEWVVTFLVDKRFDVVRSTPQFARIADVNTIATQDLAFLRSQVSSNPKSLAAVASLSRLLKALGQNQEALALIESALANLTQDENYYTDKADELNWIYDAKAGLLARLGRYDESVAAYNHGKETSEFGSKNVSQAINLAAMQIEHSHYDEALDSLRLVSSERSRYADSLVAGLRTCANFLKSGSDPQLADTITLLRSLGLSGQASLISTYICVGDVDAAAVEFLKMLENPETRADALITAITHKNRVPIDSQHFRITNPRIEQMLARPEIAEAVNRLANKVDVPYYWPQYSF